jgi:uncharacterized flavoprotein (TIGR03862 family)
VLFSSLIVLPPIDININFMPMPEKTRKTIAIIGSGPSAMMLAAFLDGKANEITIYEKNFAPGRKFLVAGDGGFNLTHSEDLELFISRYTPSWFLEKSLRSFTNKDLCGWLKNIGIETYTGSSKRIFPVKGIKPIDVLNAILKELKKNNVLLKTQHKWIGWNEDNKLLFRHDKQEIIVSADIIVFALGGASWGKTGSDGTWTDLMEAKGIKIIPFKASNCAYEIKWDRELLKVSEGKIIKNITLTCGDKEKPGEVVITRFGLEGGAVYALSPEIRKQLNENKKAIIYMDLKPVFSLDEIKERLRGRGNRSYSKLLEEELHLTEVQIALLKSVLTKEEYTNKDLLPERIKRLPLQILNAAPVDEAISTVGGIALDEVDGNFQLKQLSGNYVIGEMLDWDAPTGGYLLQGCFSMGHYLAEYINKQKK